MTAQMFSRTRAMTVAPRNGTSIPTEMAHTESLMRLMARLLMSRMARRMQEQTFNSFPGMAPQRKNGSLLIRKMEHLS